MDYNLFMIFAKCMQKCSFAKCTLRKKTKNEDVKLHMKKVQFFAFFANSGKKNEWFNLSPD
jgi:hypothetical protein